MRDGALIVLRRVVEMMMIGWLYPEMVLSVVVMVVVMSSHYVWEVWIHVHVGAVVLGRSSARCRRIQVTGGGAVKMQGY